VPYGIVVLNLLILSSFNYLIITYTAVSCER